MKLIKFSLVLLLMAGFSACEDYHAKDTVDGTPTKADTVLPAHSHDQSFEPPKTEAAPGVFRR